MKAILRRNTNDSSCWDLISTVGKHQVVWASLHEDFILNAPEIPSLDGMDEIELDIKFTYYIDIDE